MTQLQQRDPALAAQASYERMGKLISRAPHLAPILFEAVLHLPMHMMYDPEESDLSARDSKIAIPRCTVPILGIPTPSYLAYSHEHYWSLASKLAFKDEASPIPCAKGVSIRNLMPKLIGEAGAKLYVDPGLAHGLCLIPADLKAQFEAWAAAPLPKPFFGYCRFENAHNLSQVLLDRLCCFLSGMDEVVQAFVPWVTADHSSEPARLVLVIRCSDWQVLKRISNAIPLLNWGLDEAESLHHFVGSFYDGSACGLTGHLAPVYDRSVAFYLKPKFGSAS